MPTVAELFDSFPSSKDAEIGHRRKMIFEEIQQEFIEKFQPDEMREWDNTSEGVPVTIYVPQDDIEWFKTPETQTKLKKSFGFADRTDVEQSIEINEMDGVMAGKMHKVTVTLTKVAE